jgi:Ras-related protein Rab-5C
MNTTEHSIHSSIELKLNELKLPHGTRDYKTVFLGSCGAGKSSVVARYTKGFFNQSSGPTIGAAFCVKKYNYSCGDIKLSIWDTAGQERYDALMPMYYRGSDIAFVVFDLTDSETFIKAKKWIDILEQTKKDKSEENNNLVIILVGNKSDMDRHLINNLLIDGTLFAREHEIEFIKTSAKTGHNINNLFLVGVTKQLESEKKSGRVDYKLENSYPIFFENDDLFYNNNTNSCSGNCSLM